MKLDSRIKEITDILTCVNAEEARKFIGQKGYFADHIGAFKNLSDKEDDFDVLVRVDDAWEQPFVEGNIHWRYFIPESRLLKEKKLRPFTLKEFINNVGDVGGCVRYKRKDDPEVFRSVITEIRETSGKVVLGHLTASFEGLLFEFEYYDNGSWIPFGVKE